MEQIEIEFQYDKETLKQAYRLQLKRGLMSRWWIWIVFIVVMMYFLASQSSKTNDLLQNFMYVLVSVGIAFILLNYWTPGRFANRLLKLQAFQNKIAWIITSEKIKMTTLNSTAELNWAAFQKAIVSSKVILLLLPSNIMHIVPVDVFKENELELFKTWIRANIKEVKEG